MMDGIPTKTAEMREAIILALAYLHFSYPDEKEGWLSSEIQFRIATMADRIHQFESAFMDRDSSGKAFGRAMQQLEEAGIVVKHPDDPNEIERVLAIYLQAKEKR